MAVRASAYIETPEHVYVVSTKRKRNRQGAAGEGGFFSLLFCSLSSLSFVSVVQRDECKKAALSSK